MMKYLGLVLLVNFNIQAADVSMCGAKPNMFSRFFTDAEKIRVKCINDAFDKEKKDRDTEVEKLDLLQKKLDEDLKKVAYQYSYSLLICDNPEHTWPKKKVEDCQTISKQRNAIISRIDHLMGWDQPIRSSLKNDAAQIKNESIEVPCPTQDELDKIQSIRYFDRKLYKTWERCVNLRQ